jgi:6-phosphogluconolactonase (cycloisomerase 2 family)
VIDGGVMIQIDNSRLTRRQVLAGGVGIAAFGFGAVTRAQEVKPIFVYVGSYTKNPPGGGSSNPVGLSVFQFNPTNGAFSLVEEVPSANPSFVALDPTRRFLYVVNEIADYEGQRAGSAEAYAINPTTGRITLLNRQSVKGPIPAHLALDPTGQYLVVANYVGGDFVVLPIERDGRLGPVTSEIIDTGHGPNAQRQASPHPHGITFHPAGQFLATADLGTDQVQIFRLAHGNLATVSQATTAPGSGPRHVVFHPNGQVLFVINELNATVTSFVFDPDKGQIGRELQTISTEPPGYTGPKSTAEIAIHPSGRFLYASNRGHNSIVGYRIEPATSRLGVIGYATEGVVFPRNFAIDPSGAWLYVANQKADTIVQFQVDLSTGELKPTGQATPSITPVAIVFRPSE